MSDLLTCPHCSTLVAPTNDGRCPVCDQVIGRTAAVQAAAPHILRVPVQFQPGPPPASQGARFWTALYASTPRLWVTPTLIVVNVVIFLAMLAVSRSLSPTPATIVVFGANCGPKTLHGEWWRLFASMFLHFNILHIGLNMWALVNLGQLMERLVGNLGFLTLYLVSGVLGSVASVAWNPQVTSAGASGAVFGVGGALLGFLLLRRDTIPAPVLVPLRNSMFSFIGYNVLFGFLVPGIDNAAHLGGLAGGIGCGLLLSHPLTREGVSRRWLRNAILLVVGLAIPAGVIQVLPEPTADLRAELQRVSEVEGHIDAQYDILVRRFRDKKLSKVEFAGEIENNLLPELTKTKTHFDSLRTTPADRKRVDQVRTYLQLRVESYQSLVIGLRDNNQKAMKRHREQSATADSLAKQISENAD